MPGADAGAKITTTHVRILTVNDVYAEEPVRGRGGWAGLASLVRRYRASAPGHSLLCVCGDFLGGSAALVKSKGQSGVDIMDALGVDLVVPGNHEFDYGDEHLLAHMRASRFQWVNTNIFDKTTGDYFCPDASQPTWVARFRGGNAPPGDATAGGGVGAAATRSGSSGVAGAGAGAGDGGDTSTGAATDAAAATDTMPYHDFLTDADAPRADDVRIGFFGLCTTATRAQSYPSDNVDFKPPVACGKAATAALRAGRYNSRGRFHAAADSDAEDGGKADGGSDGKSDAEDDQPPVDIVVGLTHVRVAEDKLIAKEVDGVEILLGGHDHDPVLLSERDTYVFKCGQNAYWLGVVDIRIDVTTSTSGKKRVTTSLSMSMVANYDIPPEPRCPVHATVRRIAAEMQALEGAADANPDEVLMTLPAMVDAMSLVDSDDVDEDLGLGLDTRTDLVRRFESGFANVIADAMAYWYGRPGALEPGDVPKRVLGVINGGFVRGDKMYPAGHELTVRELRRELPFPREVVLIQIKRCTLRAAIEGMMALAPAPSGGYPHLGEGAEGVYDLTRPVGERLLSFKVYGEEVAPSDERPVLAAITGFMAGGGDHVEAWLEAEVLAGAKDGPGPVGPGVCDALLEYLRTKPHGDVSYHPRGRLVKSA